MSLIPGNRMYSGLVGSKRACCAFRQSKRLLVHIRKMQHARSDPLVIDLV